MSAGRCYGVVKYLIVFINILFFILSIGMLVLAIWMLIDPRFYVSLTQDPDDYKISTYIFLCTGLLLLIVSFVGCCGAFRESTCLLVTFFSFLLIIIVAQVTFGLWTYSNSDSLESIVRVTVKSIVQAEYYNDEQRKALYDDIQSSLKCCGAERPSDWNPSSFKHINMGISSKTEENYQIPTSCCRTDLSSNECQEGHMKTKIGGKIDYSLIYSEGCTDKVIDALRYNINVAYIVGLVALIIEVIGLTFAIILACSDKRSSRYKS